MTNIKTLTAPAEVPKVKTPPAQVAKIIIEQAEAWIKDRYHIQYNNVKLENEIIHIETGIRAMDDDRGLNNIYLQMAKDGMKVSKGLIRDIINSDTFIQYNPFNHYFENLTAPDGADHIAALAETIAIKPHTATLNGKEYNHAHIWPQWLRKWIVGVVAGATTPGINTTCLTLIGRQGEKKSKFLQYLTPPGLEAYTISQHINPNTHDLVTQNLLCEMAIINLDDQLESMFNRDYNLIKNMITLPFINNRKTHRKYEKRRPRTASFCASVNSTNFLTDDYNRRFLCFEVEAIGNYKNIDQRQLWAQAYKLCTENFIYWFTREEEALINAVSQTFRQPSIEEELLTMHYSPATGAEPDAKLLQHGEILNHLQSGQRIALKPGRLTDALKALGYTRTQRHRPDLGHGVYGYLVIPKNS